ncbi:MAG: SoxR reducing system RseC family protein [Oscillospiraceae bacterium]|nr:SoxR reducing system RseC family protein [Oscillospiraceae bacterium]
MIQTAIVKRILSSGQAEVSLMRQMECGLSCKSCEGCPQKPKDELLALADNAVGAAVGDVVTVKPNRCGTSGAVLLVWLLPCIGLILGYILAGLLGSSEGICIAAAFGGLAVGFVPAVIANRIAAGKNGPEFTIVSLGR